MLLDALPASIVFVEDVVSRAVEDSEIFFSKKCDDELPVLERVLVVLVEPVIRRECVMIASIFGGR